MKKVFLALAVAVLAVSAATASPAAKEKKIKIGLMGVAALDNAYGTNSLYLKDVDHPSVLGGGGGLMAQFKVGKSVVVEPELLYVLAGLKANMVNNDPTMAFTIINKVKLGYLELPVLLKYGVMGGKVKPTFFVGPALGMLMSAKNETPEYVMYSFGTPIATIPAATEDVKKIMNGTNVSVVGGVGWEIDRFTADLRGEYGFTDLYKDTGLGTTKLKVVKFTAGYFIL